MASEQQARYTQPGLPTNRLGELDPVVIEVPERGLQDVARIDQKKNKNHMGKDG